MSESAAAKPTAPSKRRVFASRLFSTLLLWAVLVFAFNSQKEWLVMVITGLFGIAGAVEYYRLLRADPHARSFNVLGLLICVGYWIAVAWWLHAGRSADLMWLDLVALTASVHGSFLLCYRQQLEGVLTLQRIFNTVFGVVYTVIFFGFMVKVIYLEPAEPMKGCFLLLFLIMVTKFSDMGAYVFGVIFGKHKMIPHISPAKSWEGFAGSFVGSFLAAAILLLALPEKISPPLSWLHGMILAPVLCATAVTGDLAESVLKRCVAIKDSGHKLPGIGGILDLTDSLLFTAPVFYFYLSAIAR
ncbi:MAG: phosphatidate cytidylyltransferase [Prosthecobacter sp.]|uniref:phosphatidate cytidylyltransferase n=1 Tax=Prosthecobacter sp. TaxID=1965333 RepID=UPI0019EE1702|nr:phosphatidate cytidylyltransferase [Prosthecobacter sp.]MBE2284844.1 phosphatidate cytidylyltransferase [Prosthecobacter sp.]